MEPDDGPAGVGLGRQHGTHLEHERQLVVADAASAAPLHPEGRHRGAQQQGRHLARLERESPPSRGLPVTSVGFFFVLLNSETKFTAYKSQ